MISTHRVPAKNAKKRPAIAVRILIISIGLLFAASSIATAEEPDQYFRDNCFSCHTIGGGRLTGPDLKDVEERRDRDWLVKFIQNPKATIDSGDPYAQEIFDDAGGVLMPNPARITPELTERLLDLIAAESELEESEFAGLQIPNGPFSQGDINRGYNYG